MLSDKRVRVVPAVNQCNHAIANHNESHAASYGGDDKTVKFCQAHGISYSACESYTERSTLSFLYESQLSVTAFVHTGMR